MKSKFNPYFIWQTLFQHLEGAPMHDYLEFEVEEEAKMEGFRGYWAADSKNLFGSKDWRLNN